MSKINVKFRISRFWGGAVIVAFILVVAATRLYADAATWVDGGLPVLTVGQPAPTAPVSSCFPSTFTYFTYTKPDGSTPDATGRTAQTAVCELQNGLGFYGASSNATDDYNFVRPGTSTAFRVVRANSLVASVTPVPGQSTFITKDATGSGHGEVAPHFYDSFSSAGTFGQFTYGSTKELAFQINQSGTVLKDAAGKTIYMHAYAFSPDGQWMVIEAANLGFLRINTQTRQMQLFSTEILTYSLGFTPKATLAITDDGNTVIKSGNNAGETIAYDLSGCQPGSFNINGNNSGAVVGCRSRVLTVSLQSQMAGFAYLIAMHFSADGKSMSLLAGHRKSDGVIDYFSSTYTVAGYQMPHLSYLALGDSFSSGEGVFSYEPGTNSDNPRNKCHLSTLSYPYLAASATGISDFHSVACSGAATKDYYGAQFPVSGQASLTDIWLPGVAAQKNYFKVAGTASIVTISMIGNDIGFANKMAACIGLPDDCFHFKEDRQMIANEIYNKFDTLVSLYSQIRIDSGNPDVKIYVLGYPQLVGDGACRLNVPLSLEERVMAQGLTSYLDAVIHAAADRAGVQYIDTEHAFDGHRLCDGGTPAVYGLVRGNDFGPLGSGNFHPNALGHQLLAQALLAQSQNLTSVMPAANSREAVPYAGSDVYNNFIAGAPSANWRSLAFTSPTTLVTRAALGIPDLLVRGGTAAIHLVDVTLQPASSAQVWIHSSPVLAGTLMTDAQGQLTGDVTIPADLATGYHTVEVIAKDIGGEDVDLYQTVYVAASDTDINGDGIPDGQEACVVVPDSGIDHDKDGTDDACDPDITDPPADSVPPIVTGIPDRAPNLSGWYNQAVAISWLVADPDPSSGVPTVPGATTAALEGDHTYQSQPSCDPAGNCATGSLELRVDTSPPVITSVATPGPNASGWNNMPATVTFSCSDALSGVATCSDPVAMSADGQYVVTGTATDNAGNEGSVNAVVSIDQTAPRVNALLSVQPNAYGWNNSDVTVSASCSDNLSGVASCSAPQAFSTEGAGQVAADVCLDQAGNLSTILTSVNIDKTAPTVQSLAWSANPKAMTGPSVLTVRAADGLSGIGRAEYFIGDNDPGLGKGLPLTASDGDFVATFGTDLATGVYKVTVRVQDKAGNWSPPGADYLVVYNPFATRLNGKHALLPSLANGDYLPGLVDASQTDTATFGFSAGYDSRGQMLKSDMQFSYATGKNCNQPLKAQNCHNTELNAGSVDWLAVTGVNNATGIFEGSTNLVVDGLSQAVRYRVVALDGERLSSSGQDHLWLAIFAKGADPNTATPLYQVNADVLRGNIHIKI